MPKTEERVALFNLKWWCGVGASSFYKSFAADCRFFALKKTSVEGCLMKSSQLISILTLVFDAEFLLEMFQIPSNFYGIVKDDRIVGSSNTSKSTIKT